MHSVRWYYFPMEFKKMNFYTLPFVHPNFKLSLRNRYMQSFIILTANDLPNQQDS